MLITSGLQAQCEPPFDFNTFQSAGPGTAEDWVVNGPGTSVSQELNQQIAFYVSPMDFSSVRLKGKVFVSPTSADDDYIGFCFGLQSPETTTGSATDVETWLIDWRGDSQLSFDEGYALDPLVLHVRNIYSAQTYSLT